MGRTGESTLENGCTKEDLYELNESLFLLNQVSVAFDEKRFEDAIEILHMTLERNPDLNEALETLAKLYKITRHPNKAVWIWEELCGREPENIEYSLELAKACYHRGWHRKAARQCEQTITLDPDCAEARELLIKCRRYMTEFVNEAKTDNRGWQSGTYRREGPKTGRNDPCPCGSGKKYKKCCGA